ncbi:hypothetical protein PM082_013791 [Marasmius tenuissimus]|nr:hypothetical protein PM082_013791 [Marasmius tenuissimus]
MGYDLFLSEDLHDSHPVLLTSLQSLFSDNSSGEDIDVAVLPSQIPGMKTVQWGHGFDTSLTLLWLTMGEVATHLQNDTLAAFLAQFRDHLGYSDPQQHTTILLLFGDEQASVDPSQVELEMCRMELQYSCLRRRAESEHDAAVIIHAYTRGT